jgi:hypothetical protein
MFASGEFAMEKSNHIGYSKTLSNCIRLITMVHPSENGPQSDWKLSV